jgi:hypothetical protein
MPGLLHTLALMYTCPHVCVPSVAVCASAPASASPPSPFPPSPLLRPSCLSCPTPSALATRSTTTTAILRGNLEVVIVAVPGLIPRALDPTPRALVAVAAVVLMTNEALLVVVILVGLVTVLTIAAGAAGNRGSVIATHPQTHRTSLRSCMLSLSSVLRSSMLFVIAHS